MILVPAAPDDRAKPYFTKKPNAMIHYIDPDSADLTDSPNDLALVTTDRSIARNFFHMVDSIWKRAKSLKRKRRGR